MKRLIFPLIFLMLIASDGVSQMLDQYLVTAARNNPGLKAKFLRYQAALERMPQAEALPDPQASFVIFVMPMERYAGQQVAGISLMQMFPWFGTRSAAKDEKAFLAKAKYEAFNEARANLFFQVRVNWYAMHLLEKEVAIINENIKLLKNLEQIAISSFKSGGQSGSRSGSRGEMKDVLRLQMEINELENHVALLTDSRATLWARFNQLLNRSPGDSVQLSDSITPAQMPVPITQVPDSIKRYNPMLIMLEKRELAFKAQEEVSRKRGLPAFGVGLQYGVFRPGDNRDSPMNGRNMLSPTVSVTIPIWREKYSASRREANLLRQSAEEQQKDIKNQLMVSYEEAIQEFEDARRRTLFYEKQTDLANQVLDILMVQYATEDVSVEEVLRVQEQLLDYQVKHLDAVIDGHIAVAMMQKLMGR